LSHSTGQWVAEKGGNVHGVLYTQRIASIDSLTTGSFVQQLDFHDDAGPVLQLCAVTALSDGGNVGALLRDHALRNAKFCGLTEVVAMTRCSNFNPRSDSEATIDERKREYQRYVQAGRDPTLFFHLSGGASIYQIVWDYRPEDVDNLGSAILVRYPISTPTSLLSRIRDKVHQITESTAQAVTTTDFFDSKWMNLLDSMQLMILHNWLEETMQRPLSPTFLFTYATPRAVSEYFNQTGAPLSDVRRNQGILLSGVCSQVRRWNNS
jgi:polyketide synthase PksN